MWFFGRREKTALTRLQLKHVRAAFRSFSGPDELIDLQEWKQALGLRNDFLVKRIFSLVDADGTGFIDWDEFLTFAGFLCSDDPRRRLSFVFRIYDLNGDGVVDRPEFEQILAASLAEQSVSLPERMVRAMTLHLIKRVDADEDGQVSQADFIDTLADYPGLTEQFSIYAADWLNQGRGFRSSPARAASLRLRLKRLWQNNGCAWVWLLGYAALNAALFSWAARRYGALGADPWVQVARGAGACLNFNGACILLPMCRSLWTAVRRFRLERFVPLDGMSDIHRTMGHAVAVLALVHAGAHGAHALGRGESLAAFLVGGSSGLTGTLLLVMLGLMWITARFARGRRREAFAAAHYLYVAWLVVLLLHGPAFWMWLAAPALVFLADALVRWGFKTRRVTIVELKPLSDGVTWVRFKRPKGFHFQPGDYLHLNVPALSPSQWHPFTISAAPEAEELGVHVRINGDWTGALHNLSRKQHPAGRTWPAVIDGPYGAPSSRVMRSKVAVLIAGGIGVTPFASVLQSLLLRRKSERMPDQTIHFHWLNRSHRSYEWFVELLGEAERALGDRFRVNIHLTSLTHDLTNIAMQVAMDAYRRRHRKDPVTGLRAMTSAGRPDWDEVFSALAMEHPGERVEVFFCGPQGLGATVRSRCRKHGFIMHEEKF